MTTATPCLAPRPRHLDDARLGIVVASGPACKRAAALLASTLERRHFLAELVVLPAASGPDLAAACDVVVIVGVDDGAVHTPDTEALVELAGALEARGTPTVTIVLEQARATAAARAATAGCTALPVVALRGDELDALGIAGPTLGLVEHSLTVWPPAGGAEGPQLECTC